LDPDPGSQNLADADPTDPDPKHWKYQRFATSGYREGFEKSGVVAKTQFLF